MDYPRYRKEGLPITSSHMESTVKRFNRRVKGTEKTWGQAGAEQILQLRAAYLSEDGRLDDHQSSQPCSPFRNYKARKDTGSRSPVLLWISPHSQGEEPCAK